MPRRARSAFFTGAAHVFDLGGSMSRGSRRSFDMDGRSIRSDWNAVGEDFAGMLNTIGDPKGEGEASTRSYYA